MKASDWNEELHQYYLASIQTQDAKDAYLKFCEIGFSLRDYVCKVANQGEISVVQLRFIGDKNAYHFGTIVNQQSLLFYARRPFLRHIAKSADQLLGLLPNGVVNKAGELKVRLSSEQDVINTFDGLLKAYDIATLTHLDNLAKVPSNAGANLLDENQNSNGQVALPEAVDTARNQINGGHDMDEKAVEPEAHIDSVEDAEKEESIGEVIHDDLNQIRWRDESWSISDIYRRHSRGRIDLQPEFQRHFVWAPKIQRRFIESIMLGLPVPKIYLSQAEDNSYLVIDGQQRLQTIVNYRNGGFSLNNEEIEGLRPALGLKFQQLPDAFQNRFEEYCLSITVLDRSCSPELKFDMFERLNQGSVKLNRQELRNCIYRGTYNKLLSTIADSSEFLRACGWQSTQSRMKGEEMALRFFAFHHKNIDSIKTYDGALNDEMRSNQNINERLVEEYRKEFKEALQRCVQVFGPEPFRMWSNGKSTQDPNGGWQKILNSVVFEVLMTSLINYEKPTIVKNADGIREEFIALLSSDQSMVDSLTLGTNSREKMQYRHNTWRNQLRNLIGSTEREPRLFSLSFKERLFQADATCTGCGQRIHDMSDAAVDHIEHYWRGGRTIPENGRLMHRYCNSRRGGRD